jgi:DNA-binding winged helix-turn-helix (wHTH) protein/TolB-like protein
VAPRSSFGLFNFDPATGELRREGRPVRLQPQPAKVLAVLVERAGDTVSRDELRQIVWPEGTFVDFERGLNFCIAQIRSALGDSADSPRFIETIPRRGYRFVAPVRTVAETEDRAPEPQLAVPIKQEPAETAPAPTGWGGLGAAAVVVSGLLLLVLAVAVVQTSRKDDESGAVRVAVVPFDNETGTDAYSGLGQGIADTTVARLATPERLGKIAVIGNSAALRRPRSFRDLKAIGGAVDARFVVLAQVKRDATRVRLIAHLIRVSDEAHVWAQTFDRDAFTLEAQAEIAEAIAVAVTQHVK